MPFFSRPKCPAFPLPPPPWHEDCQAPRNVRGDRISQHLQGAVHESERNGRLGRGVYTGGWGWWGREGFACVLGKRRLHIEFLQSGRSFTHSAWTMYESFRKWTASDLLNFCHLCRTCSVLLNVGSAFPWTGSLSEIDEKPCSTDLVWLAHGCAPVMLHFTKPLTST